MVLLLPAAEEPLPPDRVLTSPSTARRPVVMVTVETARQEKSRRTRDEQNIPLEVVGFIVLITKFLSRCQKKKKFTLTAPNAQ